MTRWEYRVLARAAQDDLNKLGADGWELTAAVYDPDRMIHITYLKRPIGDHQS